MKKLFILITIILFASCSDFHHPDYKRNLEITKQWFDVFITEDLDATMDFYADNIEYQSTFYGGPIMNKEELGEYFKGWQDALENISWEAQNYLPGVDPETSLPNGSFRTYGHWSGTHQFLEKALKVYGITI